MVETLGRGKIGYEWEPEENKGLDGWASWGKPVIECTHK